LYEGGVACLDGKCFGAQGDGYLRLSYASSFENILEAVERIRRVSSKWTAKT
jgi:aminotransferase